MWNSGARFFVYIAYIWRWPYTKPQNVKTTPVLNHSWVPFAMIQFLMRTKEANVVNSKTNNKLYDNASDPLFNLKIIKLRDPWVSSALSFIGGVHIGAIALLEINLYGLATFYSFKWFLPAFATLTYRGEGSAPCGKLHKIFFIYCTETWVYLCLSGV